MYLSLPKTCKKTVVSLVLRHVAELKSDNISNKRNKRRKPWSINDVIYFVTEIGRMYKNVNPTYSYVIFKIVT